jgi:hypothetical protein
MRQTYRCLVKGGHVGSGKYVDRYVIVKARNVLEALTIAKRIGGVKKGHFLRNGASVLSIQTVT